MQAREKHLDWLESALSEIRAMAEPVTAHEGAGMDPDTLRQHLDIVQVGAIVACIMPVQETQAAPIIAKHKQPYWVPMHDGMLSCLPTRLMMRLHLPLCLLMLPVFGAMAL